MSTPPESEGAAGVVTAAGGGEGGVLAGGALVGVDPALLVPLLLELTDAEAPLPDVGAPSPKNLKHQNDGPYVCHVLHHVCCALYHVSKTCPYHQLRRLE